VSESRVRFRYTLTGEYEMPLDEKSQEAYGTLDPKEMAKVDEKNLIEDPLLFMVAEMVEAKIEVLRVYEPKEDQ